MIREQDWFYLNLKLALEKFWKEITACTFLLMILIIQRGKHQRKFTKCNEPDCFRCSEKSLKRKLLKQFNDFYRIETNSFNLPINNSLSLYHDKLIANSEEIAILHMFKNYNPLLQIRESLANDITLLEDSFSIILSEYKQISQDISSLNGWKINNTPSGKWCIYSLINQGKCLDSNAIRCPKTCAIIEKLHYFMSDVIFGNACFSLVFPETEIAEHCGPCSRARCHLGLFTPPGASIKIDKTTKVWEEGKCLLFDDVFPHSVKYLAPSTAPVRVVFMVDLWHPLLTEPDKNALKIILKS